MPLPTSSYERIAQTRLPGTITRITEDERTAITSTPPDTLTRFLTRCATCSYFEVTPVSDLLLDAFAHDGDTLAPEALIMSMRGWANNPIRCAHCVDRERTSNPPVRRIDVTLDDPQIVLTLDNCGRMLYNGMGPRNSPRTTHSAYRPHASGDAPIVTRAMNSTQQYVTYANETSITRDIELFDFDTIKVHAAYFHETNMWVIANIKGR